MADVRRCVGHTQSDFNGRLISVDALFCELLLMSEADLVGRDILDLTHPDDREDTNIDMRRLRDEGRPFQIEKRYVRSDGSTVWAEVHATIVSSVGGEKHIDGRIFLTDPKPLLVTQRARSAAVHDALSQLATISALLPRSR